MKKNQSRIENNDQSKFVTDQEILLPPPEIKTNKKARRINILFIAGMCMFVAVIVLIAVLPKSDTPEQVITIKPTITPTPEISQLQKEILELEELMKLADPTDDFDAIPPVDMQLNF